MVRWVNERVGAGITTKRPRMVEAGIGPSPEKYSRDYQSVNNPLNRGIVLSTSMAATDSSRSVSSLNSRLLAHGYAKNPINLSGLSDTDQAHVSSVIAELLGASVVRVRSSR